MLPVTRRAESTPSLSLPSGHEASFAVEHILLAINSCFYGEMMIKFEHGRIVLLDKKQTFKPKRT